MRTPALRIAENVRRRRTARGWTQAQLAEKAKLNPVSINRIENGKRDANRKSVEAIAEALACTVDELLGIDAKTLTDKVNAEFTCRAFVESAEILRRLSEVSELRRNVILAILYNDPALVHDGPEISRLVLALAKVC